jgi:hypothetical protein
MQNRGSKQAHTDELHNLDRSANDNEVMRRTTKWGIREGIAKSGEDEKCKQLAY